MPGSCIWEKEKQQAGVPFGFIQPVLPSRVAPALGQWASMRAREGWLLPLASPSWLHPLSCSQREPVSLQSWQTWLEKGNLSLCPITFALSSVSFPGISRVSDSKDQNLTVTQQFWACLNDKLLGVQLERIPLMDLLSSACEMHAPQRKLLCPATQPRYSGRGVGLQSLGTHLGLSAITGRHFPGV